MPDELQKIRTKLIELKAKCSDKRTREKYCDVISDIGIIDSMEASNDEWETDINVEIERQQDIENNEWLSLQRLSAS